MAINKKGSKVSKPGYPEEFVSLVTGAAKAYSVSKWFEDKYKNFKLNIEAYLSREDCPITINIGQKGASPRVEGVGTLIVTQPERLDNRAAVAEVVRLLKAGSIRPDDLLGIVSSVNKEMLSVVIGAEGISKLIKRNSAGELPVEFSVRVAADFSDQIVAGLENQVAEKIAA